MNNRSYIAIDLKSFYASVECVERGLDPLTTNLVVADSSRTEKTICLAVSPSMKAYGIPGRARLFEVIQKVDQLNVARKDKIEYIVAKPRMALYMKYSTDIYKIYLKYVAPEDIHVYSCDEVFMDVTAYLDTYKLSATQLAMKMIRDVLFQTGITATAGVGTNLYLAKIAMDIEAKHMPADENGVRIAYLDEKSYREKLWSHRPLTDFWRVGNGTIKTLEHMGLYTMGDIARFSEINEDALYKQFGVNAELLIDHAWGWEPCTMEYIKKYRPKDTSYSLGQVLKRAYSKDEARIIIMEMADQLALDLVEKGLVTDQLNLYVGYDANSFRDNMKGKDGSVEIKKDRYGREVPKHAGGTINLKRYTSSSSIILKAFTDKYDDVVAEDLYVRRLSVTSLKLKTEEDAREDELYVQMELFADQATGSDDDPALEERLKKEKSLQKATLEIKRRYGKNAIIKGTSFREGATARERNMQIGGHNAE